MAYNGYLLKLGNYVFPHKYIKADTYNPYVSMQDVDPYTDADGYLHREAVELKALKVEFETIPLITDSQLDEIMTNIENNYILAKERSLMITAYIPEYRQYVTQKGYLADFTPQIYLIDENTIQYNSIRLAFIGGVAND